MVSRRKMNLRYLEGSLAEKLEVTVTQRGMCVSHLEAGTKGYVSTIRGDATCPRAFEQRRVW